MVLVDGKQTIFWTHFLASHAKGALIIANIGNAAMNFSLSFENGNGNPGLEWNRDDNGLVHVKVRFDAIASFAEPARLGEAGDGGVVFIQLSQQTFNDMSLVHFYLLKS